MSLSSEDKADVNGAMGKAMANKVSKVTRDTPYGHGVKSKSGLSKLGLEKIKPLSSSEKSELSSRRSKSKALQGKSGADKKVAHFKAIKDHVSAGKKSGGFNDPFWYSKK